MEWLTVPREGAGVRVAVAGSGDALRTDVKPVDVTNDIGQFKDLQSKAA
jgi:hypothetical protein